MEDEPVRGMLARIERKIDGLAAQKHGTPRHLIHPARRIADVLGVSVRTLHRWRTDSENPLVSVHLGSGLATTVTMIDAWIERRYEIEARRKRSHPRARQDVRGDPLKRKIMARVQAGDDEGDGSDVASRDFPLDGPSPPFYISSISRTMSASKRRTDHEGQRSDTDF